MPWTLDNAEERAEEAPRSFFIPPEDLRRSLKVGDEVKLIFHLQREDGEIAVERMWVDGYDPETPCFLLKRVAEADDPPPLLLFNDDGQWEAHAEQESDEELADSDSVLVWSLGYLTDRFPETEDAVREGSGRRGFMRRRQRDTWWRWQTGGYVRIDH